ncbi:hypothetical protein QZH41_006764 [Actinostola sp. cb2023]|nr:hypothetical protein QZH41_006764 [Actinostola sp. cb2023]
MTFESIHIENIKDNQSTGKKEIYATINIDLPRTHNKAKTALKGKLDTGAQGNILPLRLYREMYPHDIGNNGLPKHAALQQSNTVLIAYGGTQIKHRGTVTIPCSVRDKKVAATIYVTDTPGPAILGLQTATELNLLKLNLEVKEQPMLNLSKTPTPVPEQTKAKIANKQDAITQYPDCFNGIGKFQGEYHITLDPSVPPVVHPQRRVPISLKDDIKKELDEMVANDIITKIKEDLNAAIQREYHVTPTLEEILPKLSGANIFSIVDAKCGYWNVVLDEESSYLTTFNSPLGRYRFKRMPFGLKMSQDIFQTRIDQTFEGCTGVIGIADDIVVFGQNEEEHDANMHGMLERCKATGLKLNPDKCHIRQDEIKFYGIICSSDGIKPDPDKVSALKQMGPPANSQELQTFLGLANYMGQFIPNLSTLTAPLRELVKQKYSFTWNATYQEALDKIKDSISNEITLTYFDPKKETVLQVDASTKGLGAALLQDDKPVAFASKALTDVETRYANIERELLAVVYGYLGPTLCQRQLQMYIRSEDHRQFEPSCNPDGSFRDIQCYGAQCYCVEGRGVEIQGTRKNFIDGKPNCERTYVSLTSCQQYLQESILSSSNASRFVPRSEFFMLEELYYNLQYVPTRIFHPLVYKECSSFQMSSTKREIPASIVIGFHSAIICAPL